MKKNPNLYKFKDDLNGTNRELLDMLKDKDSSQFYNNYQNQNFPQNIDFNQLKNAGLDYQSILKLNQVNNLNQQYNQLGRNYQQQNYDNNYQRLYMQ
mmetsp:Transcript_31883/g.28914  ORF Transcript_31883/g.28914 Transcript_31883/m.28914 type:complete len:97 (-) Transcript_31883:402-692(-)